MNVIANSPTGAIHLRKLLTNRAHALQGMDSVATVMLFHRGQEIFRQSHPANHWYFVIAGVARQCVLHADGRRQIVGLLLPGDFFGFTVRDMYDCTGEAAAEGTILASYPRQRVEALLDSDPHLARELREVAFDAVCRLQAQLVVMGRITTLQKVCSFILEMETRMPQGAGNGVALPISRYDIADYLAVSVETVSRSLTVLKQRGVIKLSGTRTIRIVDRNALEDGDHDSDRFDTGSPRIARMRARFA